MSDQYEVLGKAPGPNELNKLSPDNIHLTISKLSAGYGKMEILHDLDLFVTNYLEWSAEDEMECFSQLTRRDYCAPEAYRSPISDSLYLNNGDGTFTDISSQSNISSKKGTGLGIGIADLSNDGFADIFVANDGMQDQLWINQGDNTFIDQALLYGCSVDNTGKSKASMGVALSDVDNDNAN